MPKTSTTGVGTDRTAGRGHHAIGRASHLEVVGIGASAGGLEACTRLLETLPAHPGMAFILILHLDPADESLVVDLLAGHTQMTVLQAEDGMTLDAAQLDVIPPSTYLSVGRGALHVVARPPEPRGVRMPFDVLLNSLAKECGANAVCVILSGIGSDGSLGLASVKARGGLVIAQDPREAACDGMPASAIKTGGVDLVLKLALVPKALSTRKPTATQVLSEPADCTVQDMLPKIIDLLRTPATHDFTLYKAGTLRRRIERRMAMAGIAANSLDRYLEMLQSSDASLDALARDFLINVTSFFRDRDVFALAGQPSKNIATDLGMNRQTVENHRAWIMRKTGAKSLPGLARLALAASTTAPSELVLVSGRATTLFNTLSLEMTSWLGVSTTWVRRSTRAISWINGVSSTSPGPFSR